MLHCLFVTGIKLCMCVVLYLGRTQPSSSDTPDLLTAVVSDHIVQDNAQMLTPLKILTAVQAILTESTVQKVMASYQFKVTGDSGGLYYMDLTSGQSQGMTNKNI